FFFQAEDGIRDDLVTGVQTCALPICVSSSGLVNASNTSSRGASKTRVMTISLSVGVGTFSVPVFFIFVVLSQGAERQVCCFLPRSEERRVGKVAWCVLLWGA